MKKKLNSQLLSEELKKFKLISEYSFYTDEPSTLDEDDDSDSEDIDIDAATKDVAQELGVDDSKTSNNGEVPKETPEAPASNNSEPDMGGDLATEPVTPNTGEIAPAPESDEVDVDVTSLVNGSEEAKEAAEAASHKTSKLLSKFSELEKRVSSMTDLSNKIETLEKEIIKRNPTPVEKLEMRSLSSYPYNIKLTDYWTDKEGTYDVINDKKDEYILTQDEVDNDYVESNVKKSFEVDLDDYEEEDI